MQQKGANSAAGGLMSDLSMAIPGVDEAMGFAEVMKLVSNLDYETIVFDTAPTGHTLRFLSFPGVLEKGLEKLNSLRGKKQTRKKKERLFQRFLWWNIK